MPNAYTDHRRSPQSTERARQLCGLSSLTRKGTQGAKSFSRGRIVFTSPIETMLSEVSVGEITRVIALATSPAFLFGAVAALVSLLVSRLGRIADLMRGLLVDRPGEGDERREAVLRDAYRRLGYTRWALGLSILSGIVTGWIVVLIFIDTLLALQNGRFIILAFIADMVLFTTALLLLMLELRLSVADLRRFKAMAPPR